MYMYAKIQNKLLKVPISSHIHISTVNALKAQLYNHAHTDLATGTLHNTVILIMQEHWIL